MGIELTSDRPRSVHTHIVLLAVAKALEHCHSRSVVVGSLKLSDVRENSANEPVLTGFGRAIIWQPGMQVPDPELVDFPAPELWLRDSFGPEVDIWSFGILMWELATNSQMPVDVARKLQQGRRPPALQSPYWTLMARCWTVVPTARPAAARVVAMLAGMKELMDDDALTYLTRFQESAST
jgi:serine/threonine protein kinase